MKNRLCATLIVVCFAVAGSGCASIAKSYRKAISEAHKKEEKRRKEASKRHPHEVLLPRQTGSNLDRRIIVDDESSLKEVKKRPESKRPSKKGVKTKRTEPEPSEPKKPEKAEETTPTLPDRFR
jgi:hypothetical protein